METDWCETWPAPYTGAWCRPSEAAVAAAMATVVSIVSEAPVVAVFFAVVTTKLY